jgi:hypothetical protein
VNFEALWIFSSIVKFSNICRAVGEAPVKACEAQYVEKRRGSNKLCGMIQGKRLLKFIG